MNKIHILSPLLGVFQSCFNVAADGVGSFGFHVSAKALRITINGKTVARGKSPDELVTNFKAARERAFAQPSGKPR
jgi:hypothetical protein